MREIQWGAGTHIDSAAAELARIATEHGEATGVFNDVTLTARTGDTPESIIASFEAQTAARAEAWRNSPEGRASLAERESVRRALQSKHDALMGALPALDFGNDVAVMDWLCAMQEPSDHIGVIRRKETILATFGAKGFRPNVNTGNAYKHGDRENMFRYLVGQALSGLETIGAIHSIIHKFADEWRALIEEPLHLVTQNDQPYGSRRRCCERCGRMCWPGMKGSALRWTDNASLWRDAKDSCAAPGIDARSGETRSGSTEGKSPVREAEAPDAL